MSTINEFRDLAEKRNQLEDSLNVLLKNVKNINRLSINRIKVNSHKYKLIDLNGKRYLASCKENEIIELEEKSPHFKIAIKEDMVLIYSKQDKVLNIYDVENSLLSHGQLELGKIFYMADDNTPYMLIEDEFAHSGDDYVEDCHIRVLNLQNFNIVDSYPYITDVLTDLDIVKIENSFND